MSVINVSSRREFMTRGMGLVVVGAAVPNFLIRTVLAGPRAIGDERILVVLQLSGGHDGLSAIVPFNNDDYARNRETTRLKADEVLKINDELGLHPNLKGCKDLLDQQAFAVVQGVGYPNPNRSHFLSMDIWHLADNNAKTSSSETETSYGWIGKYCDQAFQGNPDPKLVLAVGSEQAPLAIRGREHPGLSFDRPDSFRYAGARQDQHREALYHKLHSMSGHQSSDNLQFVSQTAFNANESSEVIREIAAKHKSVAQYPNSRLAAGLRTVAALIGGGLSTRVYYVFQGGFDTHAGQRARHDRLMTELGDAVAAFQKDLAAQGNADRVLTISFSEFGRRVRENWSQGTDHGTAGPMFLFGPAVNAGVHGDHPSLAEDKLDRGDLQFNIDFRSVYATVLEKWMGVSSGPVLGRQFPILDLVA